MLEHYCQINVVTEIVPQYTCIYYKKNLQTIVSKVDHFQGKWMKDTINQEQPFRVKRMLSGTDVEQQRDKRTPATKTRVGLNFSMTSLSEKVG